MKKLFLFLIAITAFCSCLQAQQLNKQDSILFRLESFVKNISVFNRLYQQEKVYLHFDNTGYFLGESIWFKAYVTTASNLKATSMSRVLYVELLDMEGNVVNTQKLCITNGQADGSIPLTLFAMKTGFYEVRAYTRMMLNWDKEYIFSRVFPVFETPDKAGDYEKKTIRLRSLSLQIPQRRAEAPSTKQLNATFYPESGQLINGLTSTVAFKVTDKEGRAQQANGCICNAQGDTISVFSTLYEGMGSFIYTPTNEKVKIWIRSKEEKKGTTFDLPTAELSGCNMQVQSMHPEQVRIMLSGTSEYNSIPLGLTVMCRGKLSLFKVVQLKPDTGSSLVIPKTELPAGVNQITLFNTEGKILAERLVYISDTVPSLKIKVESDKKQYKEFEPIKMDVSVQDGTGNPIETTLSLAVRDSKTEIPSAYDETLQTNLLLCSDLKGYVSNPEYYFESNDKSHRLALDLLMLTQGYRRYSWTQMAGVTPFAPTHKIEKGIVVEGSVKSIVRKKTQENVDVKMSMFSDSTYQQASCPTDSAGSFNYLTSDFFGKWNLQMETQKNGKRKEYWITLDRAFSPQGRPYSFYDTYIPEMKASKDKKRFLLDETKSSKDAEAFLNDSIELAEASKGAKALKEVVVKAARNQTGIISKGINIVYDVANEENKLEDQAGAYNENFYEFLTRINPFFNYDISGNAYPRYKGRRVFFKLSNSTSSNNKADLWSSIQQSFTNSAESIKSNPNAQETETEKDREEDKEEEDKEEEDLQIRMLKSSDIESIAIIEEPSTYLIFMPELISLDFQIKNKLKAQEQIVLIIAKLNTLRLKEREPIGVRVTSLQGFSQPRAFYSPNYKEYQLPKEEDFRRTLYWNPNVKTNSQGKASVGFFNNATCKEMSISAETMSPTGNFGSYEDFINAK